VKLVVVMSAYTDCHTFLLASFPDHSPSSSCCLQWYNCTAGTCDCSKPCYQCWPCSLSLLPPSEIDGLESKLHLSDYYPCPWGH